MAVKFFGQFLVENSIVTRDDLLRAIDLQEQKNLKLGEMAISLGYATPLDIERAHILQLSKDMRLGDLLVEMGLLTPAQLEDVIIRQKNTHLYIGEALVQIGVLSNEKLRHCLDDFNTDQEEFVTGTIELPTGITDSAVWEMAADLTGKMITRILNLPFHTGRCHIMRTIDSNFMLAAMDLSGDVAGRYIISVSESIQGSIARAILHEKSVVTETTEILEDAVMEFVNVICGNIAAKASQLGKVIDINIPVTIHPPETGLPVPSGYSGICFPIHIGDGEKMELILFVRQ
jgi:CheY-specific phosphatase CheX